MSIKDEKGNKFTHDQELVSDKFEILSYVLDDDIIKEGHLFYEEPKDEFDIYTELKNYLYFKDEDSEAPPAHLINTGDSGTVVLRAPTKFSWGVILGGLTLAFNLIVSCTALYFYQTNLNEKMMSKIKDLESKTIYFNENVYNKREGDLIHENLKLEISKQNEIINKLEERDRRWVLK